MNDAAKTYYFNYDGFGDHGGGLKLDLKDDMTAIMEIAEHDLSKNVRLISVKEMAIPQPILDMVREADGLFKERELARDLSWKAELADQDAKDIALINKLFGLHLV